MNARRFVLPALVGVAAMLLAGCASDGDDAAAGAGGQPTAQAAATETGSDTGPSATGSDTGSNGPAASSGGEPGSASSGSSGAAGSTGASGGGTVGGSCTPDQLPTTAPGTLTIATSEPVFEPWMVDNDPSNGEGFESAVAYAVAGQLGYADEKVTWTRVGFDEAIARQDGFDFAIAQYSISDKRKKMVDFSSGYYDVTQAVITIAGSPIDGATTVADLADAQLGAMNGTTSLQAVDDVIKPSTRPSVFKDNTLAAQALQNGQIDGLVVDLPTALYMVGAQLDDGVVVGQLPGTADQSEQFGLLLAKDSPLTDCVSQAVDALRADGTLTELTDTWLGGQDVAPVLE